RRLPAGRGRAPGRREPALVRRGAGAHRGRDGPDPPLRLRQPRQGLRSGSSGGAPHGGELGRRRVNKAGGNAVISVEHVSKRYGDFVAVDAASFESGRGAFFSMLGPSGCGKTTMLRMIAGFEEVTSGVLRLDGVDVVGVPPYRRHVNTVFQNYALFPHPHVSENR